MARILFVAYGGGHVTMLRPVAQQAMARGHDVLFLALTTARAALDGSGIPVLGFCDLWDFAADGARRFGDELVATIAPGGPVSNEESVAYLGICFADLAAEHGESEARALFEAKGRHTFLPTGLFTRFLAELRPDVVVATNSPRSEQAAILACGVLDIASVCVIDLFALQEVKWCGQPGYADRLCVLSPLVRQMFLEHGRRSDEVVLTGNPAFDPLTSPESVEHGLQLRLENGWCDEIVILWASQIEPSVHPFDGTQGDPDLPRQVEVELRRFIRRRPDCRLVVRYHPSERELFKEEPRVVFSPTTQPLPALLHAVDLVVVTASTVGLEAALVGKPVISVDRSVFTQDTRYKEFGISIGIDELDQLEPALAALVADDASPEHRPLKPLDGFGGGATRRVLDVIETLLPDGA